MDASMPYPPDPLCSRLRFIVGVVAALVVLLLPVSSGIGQPGQCNRKATVRLATDVYDRPPIFSTGGGWKLGEVVGHLAVGQQVLICEETQVSFFGLQTKTWFKVQIRENFTAWIFKDNLTIGAQRLDPTAPTFALVGVVHAASNDSSRDSGVPDLGFVTFYAIVFGMMLVGMVAKAVFDELEETDFSVQRMARRSVRAVLVSPLVALGVMQGGNYAFPSGLSYWVALFVAFQNGFFWQTVLNRR
jgi:hypothetical protein